LEGNVFFEKTREVPASYPGVVSIGKGHKVAVPAPYVTKRHVDIDPEVSALGSYGCLVR
jgi:hypothetical protein